jgi:hypothetical protein
MPEISQKMFTTQRILVLAVSTKNAGVRLIQPAFGDEDRCDGDRHLTV